ncbi:RTA1 like protein-domain-containing protein [Xylariaceae sp. FL0016]|nr:RTA1 like protein-domain-containing protein [Xylariaceae sp. FL0016]
MSKSYYQYDPSQVATLVACGLFSVNFLYAGFMTAKKRSWTWIVMLLGTLLECMGYGVRYKSAADIYNKNLYVFQFCTIVLAPVLMAAVVYVVFGRIVFHVVPPEARTTRLIWVTPRFITPIFVTFDVLALLMQLIGAVMVASVDPTEPNAADQLSRGRDIALSGLGVQLAAFGLFSVVAVRFHFTSRRFVEGLNARLGKVQGSDAVFVEGSRNFLNPKWRHLLYVVNASCVLIMVGSIAFPKVRPRTCGGDKVDT